MIMATGTRQFWADSDAAFAALRADPEAWAEYVQAGDAWAAIIAHSREAGAEESPGELGERPDPSRAGRS